MAFKERYSPLFLVCRQRLSSDRPTGLRCRRRGGEAPFSRPQFLGISYSCEIEELGSIPYGVHDMGLVEKQVQRRRFLGEERWWFCGWMYCTVPVGSRDAMVLFIYLIGRGMLT